MYIQLLGIPKKYEEHPKIISLKQALQNRLKHKDT